MLDVAERTDGALRLSPSSLYAAIKRLLGQGLIVRAGRAAGSRTTTTSGGATTSSRRWAAASPRRKRAAWSGSSPTPAPPGSCRSGDDAGAPTSRGPDRARCASSARCSRSIRASSATSMAARWRWCSPIAIGPRRPSANGSLIWIEALWGLVTQAPREHAAMLMQDLRYAVRALRKDKTFALTVLITLALGIGANTAIFQLIAAVGLRSLPVRAPHELAEVRIVGGNQGFGVTTSYYAQLTRPLWHAIRDQQKAFSGAFAWAPGRARVGERSGGCARRTALYVSGDMFGVLGVAPWRWRRRSARTIPTSRARASARWSATVTGSARWAAAIWRPSDRLRLNDDWMQIVGVTPPGFTGLAVGEVFDVVIPQCLPHGSAANLRREFFEVSVVGRLRAGWTPERATAHLDALSAGLFEATIADRVRRWGHQAVQGLPSRRIFGRARREPAAGALRPRAVAAARHDRARPADGQRQSRQPPAGPRRRAGRRGRHSPGPRRIAPCARPAVPRRVRAPRHRRRAARRRARTGAEPGPGLVAGDAGRCPDARTAGSTGGCWRSRPRSPR